MSVASAAPEVRAGALVVVDSMQYVLGERLGSGAGGSCHRSGMVDVKHFVALSLQRCVARAGKVLGVCSRLQQQEEEERVGGPSEPSNEMLAATNTNPSNPLGQDTSWSSWTLSTAVIGEQIPLPSPEDQAGAVVVVDSK
eukprot:6244864-Amphidinium_carterae.1